MVDGDHAKDRFAPEAARRDCDRQLITRYKNGPFAIERRGERDGGGYLMPVRPARRCRQPRNKGLLIGQKKPTGGFEKTIYFGLWDLNAIRTSVSVSG